MKKSLATVLAVAVSALGLNALAAKKLTNRQAIDRFFEVIDGKHFDRLGEVDAPDIVVTTPMGMVNGPEGHKQLLKGFATAIPNFKHSENKCVEAGDEIACQGKFGGDHTGPLMTPDGKTLPPTGKHVQFPYGGFAKIKDGKVSRLTVYFDVMGMMQQLAPARTASK